MNNPSTWAAVIGAIAGIFALYDRFRHRRPVLKAFAPYHWSAKDAGTDQNILAIYFRIANTSKTDGFIYLETSKLELFYNRTWHETTRLDLDPKINPLTDFPKNQQVVYGIGEAAFLSKFSSGIISFEKPLCGYLAFTHPHMTILESFTKLRFTVTDCHLRKHKFKIDMVKQRQTFDPSAK